ncbi:AMP-binding protein [uncultured Bradyrhizobium sp.]|uniref:AMP-binding protein n=1 Tax=uncultured Bradyrhizobium sp. TaxID=199684 RepID=UPI00260DD3B4|nr:AMP-binding protein [uncultured Bradyrhizobium sp.]
MQDWPLLCHKIIEHAAKYHGTQEVVTRSVEGPIHRTTYAEIHARALKVSQSLERDGIKLGDRVATIAWNTWRHLEVWYGIMGIGAICHTVNPRLFPEQIAWIVNHAQDRIVITDLTFVPVLEKIASQLPSVERFVVLTDKAHMPQTTLKNAVAYEDWIAASDGKFEWKTFDENTAAAMCYTSGTTGDPKAILAPHARFSAVASLGPVVGLLPTDRLYTGLSLTHANAQLITLGNGLSGRLPVVISRQFTKSRLWEILSRYGCTTFNLLGGMATAIFAEPEGPFDRQHDVRFVLSAGMPASMWRAFEERFGVEIFEFFGAAEGGLSLNPPGTGPVGSIGKPPLGGICEILDETGSVLPAGEAGEICFRNPDGTVAPVTYFDNPAASAAKTRDGWFHTGDIGWKDRDGWLFFSHRDGHSIRRNGDFIDSRAIETAIAAMEGVADIYVYGLATPRNTPGEKEVIAAIVAGAGFNPAGIIPACARALGSANTPTYLQIVSAIPKTASEKPQDRHLVAMIEEGNCLLYDRNGPTTWNTQERIAS